MTFKRKLLWKKVELGPEDTWSSHKSLLREFFGTPRMQNLQEMYLFCNFRILGPLEIAVYQELQALDPILTKLFPNIIF